MRKMKRKEMFSKLVAVCPQANNSQRLDLWLTGEQSLSNASATTQSWFSKESKKNIQMCIYINGITFITNQINLY